MNWDAISAVAELGGSFAVHLTLIYLAFQLKQQNKVTRAQIEQQRADSVNQVAAGFTVPENRALVSKVMLDRNLGPADLSAEELLHLKLVLFPLRANLENTYQQYKSGFISEEIYEDVSKYLCRSYGPLLLRFDLPLTRGFRKELDNIMNQDVTRRAKL